MRKRSRIAIIRDILSILREEGAINIYGLTVRANVNYPRLKPILNDLISENYVSETINKNGDTEYTISPRGREALREVNGIINLIPL
ncbi:MAG: winged helix-turn-helix domain-containing protein [Candidatus Geothermarchaeales archaeon]